MLYILDELVEDERFFTAGKKLGPNGPAAMFAMFVWSIRYARQHLTDGFIPSQKAHHCPLVSNAIRVASALSLKRVSLWKRVRGGYQITSFPKHNPTSAQVKKIREDNRRRKAAQRARSQVVSRVVSREVSQRDIRSDLIHEVHEVHGVHGVHGVQDTSVELVPPVVDKTTGAPRREISTLEKDRLPFRHYARIAEDAFTKSLQHDQTSTLANVVEWFKGLCAQAQVDYDAELAWKAVEAIARVREKAPA